MPYIPHTDEEIRDMLKVIGINHIDDLFDEIPEALKYDGLDALPEGLTELEINQLMGARAKEDGQPACFIGAGAYDHHIPAAVWQITTRGEFYSAYTPYQAEASQGTLQLLYEYQSNMTALTGLDVSNASLYDGASALAEAILMAVRANRKSKSRKILVPRTVHPSYRKVAHNIVKNQNIELIEMPFDIKTGKTDLSAFEQYAGTDIAAVVIPQPNFFGVLEDVDALTQWAHDNKALAIGIANPLSLAMLSAPSDWGDKGVDICCGEGQPLGIPLSSGGPYYGFMCCKQSLVRQMPGRIIGRTTDLDGKEGFVLTLQAREQHIRRSKATSNICTNQGLMITASTIHMALMGAEGLERAAASSHQNTLALTQALAEIDGISPLFDSPIFHERVMQLPCDANSILKSLAAHNILGGLDLSRDYPELGNSILVCATEKRTAEEMMAYIEKMERIIDIQAGNQCHLRPKDWD